MNISYEVENADGIQSIVGVEVPSNKVVYCDAWHKMDDSVFTGYAEKLPFHAVLSNQN